jgi:glutathione S-transferase
MSSDLTLVIGNRNYSSWSLRPWIFMTHAGLAFDTVRLPLDTPQFADGIRSYSPAHKVPVLLHGELRIWESIAIIEYAAELAGRGWPAARAARAEARSLAAEMHAGFGPLRDAYPMNIRARGRSVPGNPALAASIRRIDAMWSECRRRYAGSGPWLFGEYGAADAMYAPVALRFNTYGSAGLGEAARAYVATAVGDPLLQPWLEAASAEAEVIEHDEAG